ncbi:unnamed protein product [Porites lobata]|uniref:Vertnin n=1 Tax=Porites lobata TaxID=104759 RepID=A0ABN8RK61_9CNID|nr:unnamed protein product [Porites lobata]
MTDFERMFEKVRNLFASGDPSATEKVIKLKGEHEEILHKKSISELTFNNYEEDSLGTALIPDDENLPRGLRALQVSRDGNCLYNSASVLMKGDESLNGTLRFLTACELFLNAEFYANHEKLSEANAECSYSEKTVFILMLTSAGEKEWQSTRRAVEAVKAEAMSASKDKVWSSLVHLMALSTVLKRPIFSVYPNTNPALRPLILGLVHPRVSSAADVLPIYILWSREDNLDNRSGAVYQPNHFVPLVCNVCTPKDNTASATAPTAPRSQSPVFFSLKSKGSTTVLKPGTKRPRASSEISDENEVKVKKHPRTSTTHSDTYNANWKKEFTWVNFDPQKNAMYCTFCQEAGAEIAGKTDFVTGCTSFKKETLSIHGRSHRHTRARDHLLGKQKPASEGPLRAVFQKCEVRTTKMRKKR